MLEQINIQNFAIIKNTIIEFKSGMNVITGQTGAGKSIVVDAIEQLLGQRANANMVGMNQDFALIEGVFSLNEELEAFLKQRDIILEDDQLIISKKIKNDGKSQLRLNNKIVTNELVKSIAPYLVEIHSQNHNYDLFSTNTQRAYIDSFFTVQEQEVLGDYQVVFNQYKQELNNYNQLLNETIDPELLAFYSDQLKEITDNFIEETAIKELEEKEEYFKEFEQLHKYLNTSNQLLVHANVIEQVNELTNNLSNISDINDDYSLLYQQANDLYYGLLDLKDKVSLETNALYFDEDEYQIVQSKLFNYHKLLKKYSYSEKVLFAKKNELENKISFINNSEDLISKQELKVKQLKEQVISLAQLISEYRKKYSEYISKEIKKHLDDLCLENAEFTIEFTNQELDKYGQDQVNFLFNANLGNNPKPLNQVASGGEIARLMLALKIIRVNPNILYIFDEIDTGVSGLVADAIGKEMKRLAQDNTIIAITHLPQVAAYADHHLYIEKIDTDNISTSNCLYLDNDGRIKEIATMISGETISENALSHAKELLNNARS